MSLPERDPSDPILPGEVRVSTCPGPDGKGVIFNLEGDPRVVASIREAVEKGELTHLAGHPITLLPPKPIQTPPDGPRCRTCNWPRWGCGCISFDAPPPDWTPGSGR